MEFKKECEGGCGVIGTASSKKIKGKHLLASLIQMRNRGNGKGGGIAACGLDPSFFGIDQTLLDQSTLLGIAYLDLACRKSLEKDFIHPYFQVHHIHEMETISDYRSIPGLEVKPPQAVLYFVTLKKEHFRSERENEETIYQNSYRLNQLYYSSKGEKKAFVLCHSKNLLVLKMVGYGDEVILYYKLENLKAHVWIGHHRYPTKGRVWHPGGAHPFIGMNEALVHNGDFANYYSISEYLAQKEIYPHFLTDTEVAALLFDLLYRRFSYPLEYVIETIAPTTERDFALLPEDKQVMYKKLQQTHIHASPDGPWFFLIAQSDQGEYRLIGITDTSMLRPQVFALQQGPQYSIGVAASEKQAIDACLQSLAKEDNDFWAEADHYWNARGGSFNNGGAFIFSIDREGRFHCGDKFGKSPSFPVADRKERRSLAESSMTEWDEKGWTDYLKKIVQESKEGAGRLTALQFFTSLLHHPVSHKMKKSYFRSLIQHRLNELLDLFHSHPIPRFQYWATGKPCPEPDSAQATLIINASFFAPDGKDSLARAIVLAYRQGFEKVIVYQTAGHRFIGNGLGPKSERFHLEVYGSAGDYLGSGLDGATVILHGSGQDQLGQIMLEVLTY